MLSEGEKRKEICRTVSIHMVFLSRKHLEGCTQLSSFGPQINMLIGFTVCLPLCIVSPPSLRLCLKLILMMLEVVYCSWKWSIACLSIGGCDFLFLAVSVSSFSFSFHDSLFPLLYKQSPLPKFSNHWRKIAKMRVTPAAISQNTKKTLYHNVTLLIIL